MPVDIRPSVVILVLLESIRFSDVICPMNKSAVIMLINVFKYSDTFCDKKYNTNQYDLGLMENKLKV